MRTVRVTGAGTAVSPADSVEISLTVSCTRATTEAAVSETDGRVQALRASLARIGFAEKDCKTTSFDVSAEYENEHVNGTYSRKFKGYCCREVLKLAFGYTPKRLAEVVNAITAGGEEEFSIVFTTQRSAALKEEAIRAAFAEAKLRGETLASASGGRLGEIVELTCDAQEHFRSETRIAEAAVMALKSTPSIEPEDVRTRATVTVVWELL